MADRNKFEEMLEKLVAEDRKGAEELFHEIVVEKSRNIYENLLADDVKELDVEEAKKEDEEVDEASKEDDKEVDEASKEDSEDKVDEASKEEKDEETTEATDEEKTEEGIEEITPEAPAPEMGGDPADDMIDDVEDAMDGDKDDEDKGEDDEDIEDRVVDLEDALDDLKSEFEKMMGDKEEKGDDEEDSEEPMGDMGDEEKEDEALEPTSELGVEEMPVESTEKEVEETAKSQTEQMREYVEKVAEPKGEDNKAKSPVAGKNDMGGTASNIAKGSAEEKGGSAASPKEDSAGNVNVPGGKASKSMKADSKGHGAEKKGSGEAGTDKKSIIGS
jgi:hypothetical protein